MKRITKSQNSVVEQDLVLVGGTDHVEHDVGLHLVQDNPVVVEDDVARLLGGLVNEALLERLLRLQIGIRVARCACAAYQTSSPLAIAHATDTRGASCLSSSSSTGAYAYQRGRREAEKSTWRISWIHPQCRG